MPQINIPTPNISVNRNDYHGGKFLAVVALAIAAVVAGYNGWITLPELTTVGGMIGLVAAIAALVLVLIAVNTDSPFWKNVAVIAAFIAGLIAAPVWRELGDFLADLSFKQVGGLLFGLVVTLLVAIWCARKPQ